jgi:predicted kinase
MNKLKIICSCCSVRPAQASDWLTPEFHALRLRSDDMRAAMFGPIRPEFHDEPYKSVIRAAMKYAAEQSLSQGHTVVYDTNSNSVTFRQEVGTMAKQLGALPVVLFMQTSLEIARYRATVRDSAESGEEISTGYVDMMAAKIEPPAPDELVISIDGTMSVERQLESFNKQLDSLPCGV